MTLVSIIIPTRGDRPSYLKRAIESTFCSHESLAIQVVVVINGRRDHASPITAELIEKRGNQNLTIKFVEVARANVSHARNVGIKEASGELIRFLDDDDFLVPAVAEKQYLEMVNTRSDLSTYGGRIEDETGVTHQVIVPSACSDYGCAALGPECPSLTFASTYRKELIAELEWDENYHHTEDEDWMRRMLSLKDPTWIARDDLVGIWFQHSRPRLSHPIPVEPYYMNRAASILRTTEQLHAAGRLGSERQKSAAKGLWSAIHGGFYFSPMTWTGISKHAARLDPDSHPEPRLFKVLFPYAPPILIEWLLLPKRWANHMTRIAMGRLFGWNKIRKI